MTHPGWMPEAVIFDADGTLIDSMWVWDDIDEQFLRERHIADTPGLKDAIEGMSLDQTAVYFKERFSLGESAGEIKQTWCDMAYERYARRVGMKEDALWLLRLLSGRGTALALATSNARSLTEAVLARHGIGGYFQAVITGEDVKYGKPDPEIFRKAAYALHADPSRCLVFEDVLMGVRAAVRAGMKVCAVYDAHSAHQHDRMREEADHFISGFSALRKEEADPELLRWVTGKG